MSEELRVRVLAAISSLAKGPGATLEAVSEQPDLVTLECVVAESTGGGRTAASLDDVAHTVITFLEDAADSLEQDPLATTVPNCAKAARAALSLKPELVGRPYQAVKGRRGRQTAIAEWLDISKERLDDVRADGISPMGDLIGPVTQHLLRRESTYLVESRRLAQRARRPPLESALQVDWLGRFECYAKIGASLSGLRNDINVGLAALRRSPEANIEARIRKALYYCAMYLVDLRRFVSEHGYLWIVPDADIEDTLADACWYIKLNTGLDEYDESILRLTFARYPELALFANATFCEPSLQPIVRRWRAWVMSCPCETVTEPIDACEVHAVLRWITYYFEAIELQWNVLSDWYDRPRAGVKIDPVHDAQRDLPVLPPTLPLDRNSNNR
jgi:hypothetical protein